MRIKNGQSAEQDHFDLLPFIGIMMCLLGALLLVTMCMGAINIGAGAGDRPCSRARPGGQDSSAHRVGWQVRGLAQRVRLPAD
jgi:hypothetical protein